MLDPEGLSAHAGGFSSEAEWVTKATAALQTAAKGLVPHDLVVDLKMLYTAVTRCRNRLVLAETAKPPTGPWAKFTKAYEKLGLLTAHSLPVEAPADGSGKAETMMPDELVELGLDFVERVDPLGGDPEQVRKGVVQVGFVCECDFELRGDAPFPLTAFLSCVPLIWQAQRDYHNAIKFFKRAGEAAKDMLARVEAVAAHASAWEAVKRSAKEDWATREALAVDACADLLAVGLASEAAKLANLANGSDGTVVAPLVARLEALDRKWRSGGEGKGELE